jgi:hemoglobin
MRRAAVTCVVWTALLFGVQALPAHGQGGTPKPPSLYQRLGGFDGIAALFDETAPRLAGDPQFARFFSGHSTDSDLRQRQRLLELLCQESGGPCAYTGRSLKTAHAGLGIAEADWSAFEKHFTAAMDHLKIGEKEKGELLALVRRYKTDIVEKP